MVECQWFTIFLNHFSLVEQGSHKFVGCDRFSLLHVRHLLQRFLLALLQTSSSFQYCKNCAISVDTCSFKPPIYTFCRKWGCWAITRTQTFEKYIFASIARTSDEFHGKLSTESLWWKVVSFSNPMEYILSAKRMYALKKLYSFFVMVSFQKHFHLPWVTECVPKAKKFLWKISSSRPG